MSNYSFPQGKFITLNLPDKNIHFDFLLFIGGDPLSRQASHSLYTPTLMDYKDNFRLLYFCCNILRLYNVSPNFHRGTSEKGHMKLQLEKNGPWMKKYFLLEDGVLKFADSPFSNEREFRNIYMKDVISFRTDVGFWTIFTLPI